MPRSTKSLFSDSRLSQYQRDQRDQMREEITQLTSNEMENSTDALALIFSSKYAPSPIQLHEPEPEDVGQVEKTIERLGPSLNLPRGGKVTKRCQRLKIKVPYTGEKHLLIKRPRRTTHPLPTYDELSPTEIVHYVDYEVKGKDTEEIKNTIDKNVSEWQKRLDREVEHLNRDIRKMQGTFENEARRYIENHRQNMDAKNEALAELGISTQNVDQGFVEPEKKKEIELPDLDGSSRKTMRIRDKTFVDVLDIIDSMRVNVERSKTRLRDLDEESLRDIFLGAIDSHFGSATGESFNRGGKTDILLRHDCKNLFIAECKFWTGESNFSDAIDQLLGNLTVNDSHAALLVFSNRQDVAQVHNRVEAGVKNHESYQRTLSSFQNHDVYRFLTSSGSEVKVAVKVVDLGS